MIAKIAARRQDNRSSFKALTDYVLGRSGHSAGAVLHTGKRNILSLNSAAAEMDAMATNNLKCRTPAFHFILSWREGEIPTAAQVDEAVKIALEELDLQKCQAIWALQSDTDNLHAHVAVNRVAPNTHRAIDPAHGWTKKALERAARKIEIAQGWEIERTGRYDVEDGQVVEKAKRDAPELTQTARDVEAHRGGQSWERVAKQNAGAILRGAATWGELHGKLAELGFALERKGSGAVLLWGAEGDERAVKLSTVDRGSSLTKLEARLGEFQARGADVTIARRDPQPQEGQKQDGAGRLKATREQYEAERAAYLAAKSKAIAEAKAAHRQANREFAAKQRKERADFWAALKREDWRGRGDELNFNRSLMAYHQRTQRTELRERQEAEMKELKSRFLLRFPSYKRWLADQRTELFMLYRYPGQTILMPEQSGVKQPEPRPVGLRDYEARRGAKGSVLYCRSGKHTADFTDTGQNITLNARKLDVESVAAALQLANQKWGATKITGSAEYKELCVQAAVKYGLKLANADLAAEVERRRREAQAAKEALRRKAQEAIHDAEQALQTLKERREAAQAQEKPKTQPEAAPAAPERNKPVTEAEIRALNLAKDPKKQKIYADPYTKGRFFIGEVVHINAERGYYVLSTGGVMNVLKLDKLDASPPMGVPLRVTYDQSGEHATLRIEQRRRGLRR